MPPLSLLEYAQAVLCRALPCYPLKYLCEIIGIRIPNRPADVLDIHRGHGQHPLGFHHPVLCKVGCEILIKTLLKQLAEISLRIVHMPRQVLHGYVVHVIGLYIMAYDFRHLGHI